MKNFAVFEAGRGYIVQERGKGVEKDSVYGEDEKDKLLEEFKDFINYKEKK